MAGIYSEDAVKRFKKAAPTRAGRTKEICICGHSINYHKEGLDGGPSVCGPARMSCKCQRLRPVLLADNRRLFLHSTSGSGELHALGKGVLASLAAEAKVEWINGTLPLCDKCEKPAEDPYPISLEPVYGDGVVVGYREGKKSHEYNSLLCKDCYETWIDQLPQSS